MAQPYGPALDSRMLDRAKTDWLLWSAGASSPGRTRDMFVTSVARYFRQNSNNVFGDLIQPAEGWSVGFLTRPVVGGHYSLLALDLMQRSESGLGRLAGLEDQLQLRPSLLLAVAAVAAILCSIGFLFTSLWLRARRRMTGPDYVPVDETKEMDDFIPLVDQEGAEKGLRPFRDSRCASDGSFELLSTSGLATPPDPGTVSPYKD